MINTTNYGTAIITSTYNQNSGGNNGLGTLGGKIVLYLNKYYNEFIQLSTFSPNTTSITFCFWISTDDISSTIFDFGNGVSNNNIILFVNNGNLGLSLYNGATLLYQNINIFSNIRYSGLTHVSCVISPNLCNIYINSILISISKW